MLVSAPYASALEFILIPTAAKNGNTLLALRLLKAGASVDMRSENGWTALNCAVAFNPAMVACALIKYGSDTNNADCDGDTPLHIAASLGLVGLTQLLLSSGADTRVASKVSENPFALNIRSSVHRYLGSQRYNNKSAYER